jgi:hypothetical protein
MKCGARVALGVAGGYFLGRTKKMKLGLMLAGMAAGRQAGGPAALLGQGKNLLNASPELLRLTDEVKGRLLDAGKGAALAVATRQVEGLTDRVAGRVESSLGNLAERGRGATNSSGPARDDVDDVDDVDEAEPDDRPPEEYDSEPQEATATDEDRDEEPRESATDGGSSTNSAPVRRARRSEGSGEGNGQATKTAARTAVRRTAGAASGARRTSDKAAGRPARARRSNDNG